MYNAWWRDRIKHPMTLFQIHTTLYLLDITYNILPVNKFVLGRVFMILIVSWLIITPSVFGWEYSG